jgi:hypothetical protein
MDTLNLKKSTASMLKFNYLDMKKPENARKFASERDQLFSNLQRQLKKAMCLLKGNIVVVTE